MTVCMRFYIAGRVQGVYFRAATLDQARKLSLTGHAINLSDGRVEVLACGASDRIDILQEWLWQGPPLARVDTVEAETVDSTAPERFEIG